MFPLGSDQPMESPSQFSVQKLQKPLWEAFLFTQIRFIYKTTRICSFYVIRDAIHDVIIYIYSKNLRNYVIWHPYPGKFFSALVSVYFIRILRPDYASTPIHGRQSLEQERGNVSCPIDYLSFARYSRCIATFFFIRRIKLFSRTMPCNQISIFFIGL